MSNPPRHSHPYNVRGWASLIRLGVMKPTSTLSRIYFIIFLTIATLSGMGLSWQWSSTEHVQENLAVLELFQQRTDQLLHKDNINRAAKPAKREVKGIYLTAYSANSPAKTDAMIALINATELNAVVVDIKDYTGKVLYDSDVPLVDQHSLENVRIDDVPAMIEKFHEHDIYVIARQTVFQDPILAENKPEWAIASKAGGLWRDHKGLSWVDPTKKEVWAYNVEIAKEAIALGFDEINFDYVRFPSDGNMSLVVYTNGEQEKHEVMGEFYQYLSDELSGEPAWLSLDLFGFVMERHDGMSIGQRLEDAMDTTDYISPMMYPSHYPPGHLGLDNPAAHPGLVISNGMEKGMPYFASSTRTKPRPWIQAFNIGAEYGATNIRAQIDNVEKYTDGGWLLWNAANRYSSAGLKKAE